MASEYLYDGEAVLLGRKGTIDKPMYINGKFWTVDTMFYAVPKCNVDCRYMYYQALTIPFGKYSTNTALPSMTQSDLADNPLCFPSLSEQQAIASYLDHKVSQIDSAVSAIDAQIEDLKAYRQSVISEAVTKGLDQNAKMKDSGIEWIGEIQERWIVSKLKYVADIVMGQSPDGDSISDKGTLPFMQGNAEFGTKYPSVSKFCDCPNKCSRIGDILMSVRAPVGALNISDRVYGIGRGLCSIKAEGINRDYLFYNLFNSVEAMRALSDGSTFEAITVQNLSNLPLCVPSLSEQQAIASYLDHKVGQIDSVVNAMNSQIDDLNALKQAIISEAVTGKIDVRDWTPSV